MGIRIFWDGHYPKTVIYMELWNRWTVNDLRDAWRLTRGMIGSVPHRVDMICHRRHSNFDPQYIRDVKEHMRENQVLTLPKGGRTVMVGSPIFRDIVLHLAAETGNSTTTLFYADTVERAYQILNALHAGSQPPPLVGQTGAMN